MRLTVMVSRHTVRDFFLSVTRNPFTARLTEACSEALWVGLSLWVGTSTFLRLTPNVGLVCFSSPNVVYCSAAVSVVNVVKQCSRPPTRKNRKFISK